MSMNLVFEVKGTKGRGTMPFPFQTPTTLTYAVLNAETVEAKLEVIRLRLVEWGWDEALIKEMMFKVSVLLQDSSLNLTME